MIDERFADKALRRKFESLKYDLGCAKYDLERYKGEHENEKSEVSQLFAALLGSYLIVHDTSEGSIYLEIMEAAGLQEKYKNSFDHLWAEAKLIRIEIFERISKLFQKSYDGS